MKQVYFLCYYDDPDVHKKRVFAPSAMAKVDYVAAVLRELGYYLHFISASGSANAEQYPAVTFQPNEFCDWTFFKTVGRKNIFYKIADKLLIQKQLTDYFDHNIDSDSIVVAYHSLGYLQLLDRLKKRFSFRLIVDVEEIYADVMGAKGKRKRELRALRPVDAYIFPTRFLDEIVNIYHKPSVISHGTYHIEMQRTVDPVRCGRKEIVHCVYAGTLDPRKGGAYASVEAAEFLPENYHLHILGFGSDAEINTLRSKIAAVQSKSKATVTYDGVLSGEDYIRFLQNCDIGLSTQDPGGIYNNSSFPSKILSYLANGLRVVTVRIPVIETSDVSDIVYYYDKQTPQSIADAILSVDLTKEYDSRRHIEQLHLKFLAEMRTLLALI